MGSVSDTGAMLSVLFKLGRQAAAEPRELRFGVKILSSIQPERHGESDHGGAAETWEAKESLRPRAPIWGNFLSRNSNGDKLPARVALDPAEPRYKTHFSLN